MKKISISVFSLALVLSTAALATPATTAQIDEYMSVSKSGILDPAMKNAFAQNLTAEDIAAYMDFAKTDAGKKYIQFNADLAPLFADGMNALKDQKALAAMPVQIPQDQIPNIQHMLLQASALQPALYTNKQSRGDGTAIGVMIVSVIAVHPHELMKIYDTYAADIPAFEAYNKSGTAQNLMSGQMNAFKQITAARKAAAPAAH